MKGKFMIIAALLVSLTLGACVDSQESPSVTAVRTAKAEALKSVAALNNAEAKAKATMAAAEAELKAAQAQLLAAQAAQLNAETEGQSIANELAAAKAEAQIAKLQAKLQKELVELQKELLTALQGAAAQADSELASLYTQYETAFNQLLTKKQDLIAAQAQYESYAGEQLDEEQIAAAVAAATENATIALVAAEAEYALLLETKASIEELGVMTEADLQDMKEEVEAAQALLAEAILLKNGEIEANYNALDAARDAMAETDFAYIFNYWANPAYESLVDGAHFTPEAEDFDVDSFVFADGWGIYPVKVNADGAYEQDTTANVIPFMVLARTEEEVECDHETGHTFTYQKHLAYYELQEEGVAAYKDASAKLLETAAETRAYEVAKGALEAYAAKYDTVFTDFIEFAEVAEELEVAYAANADAAKRLAYKKKVLVDAQTASGVADAYKKEIKAIDDEIAALAKAKAELDTLDAKAEAAYDAYVAKLDTTATVIVADAVAKFEAMVDALEDYAVIKAIHDNDMEVIDALVAEADVPAEFAEIENEFLVNDIVLNCELVEMEAEQAANALLIGAIDGAIADVQAGTTNLDTLAQHLAEINEMIEAYEADKYTAGSIAFYEAALEAISVEAEVEARLALVESYYEYVVAALETEVAVLEAKVETALAAIEAYIASME